MVFCFIKTPPFLFFVPSVRLTGSHHARIYFPHMRIITYPKLLNGLYGKLTLIQFSVKAIAGEQLLMGALLDDRSFPHH